ncbi:MAG: hypothetical protein QGH60_17345 [Phycisphaerae bacterium]|jgi:hypothetical protein|nr:hypothetical protein [Phycisphaerae bacterium]
MSRHHRLLSAFLIAVVAAIASEARAAEGESFVESTETARLVATGTLKEYSVGGYIISSTGSKAHISTKINWETVHFGVKPQQAGIYRQIPVKRGTKPKLQFSKGDKVMISWQRSSQDSLTIAIWSQGLEQKVLKALLQRRVALVKKHGSAKAKLIEQAVGILGSATARAPQAAVDQLVAMKNPALPVLQGLQKELTGKADRALLEEAILCLKWKINPDKLIRQWIDKNVKGFGGRKFTLRQRPQRISDAAVGTVLGENYVFCQLRFRQWPVARMSPPPLGANNIFAIHKKLKTVTHISTIAALEKFFIAKAAPAGDQAALKTTARAWLGLSTVLVTGGYYQLAVDVAGITVTKGKGWEVVARSIVRRGGRGHIQAKLSFDAKRKLLAIVQKKKLVSGPRPICQSTKLLDSDPIVRGMARQNLRTMGLMAREYLIDQRKKVSPELQQAIDNIWQQILQDERELEQ